MRTETFKYLRNRLNYAERDRFSAEKRKIVVPRWVSDSTKRLKKYHSLTTRLEERIRSKVNRESKHILEMIMLHREIEALRLLKKFESKKL